MHANKSRGTALSPVIPIDRRCPSPWVRTDACRLPIMSVILVFDQNLWRLEVAFQFHYGALLTTALSVAQKSVKRGLSPVFSTRPYWLDREVACRIKGNCSTIWSWRDSRDLKLETFPDPWFLISVNTIEWYSRGSPLLSRLRVFHKPWKFGVSCIFESLLHLWSNSFCVAEPGGERERSGERKPPIASDSSLILPRQSEN